MRWIRSIMILLEVLLCWQVPGREYVRIFSDRSVYAAGETVWLRVWVNAEELPASKYVYVELLRDEQGLVEQRVKLKERAGLYLGQMELADNLESGWYTLRAYTLAQKDFPADELCHARLLIKGEGVLPAPARGSIGPEGEIDMSVERQDSTLVIALTDRDGKPLPGDFALSVTDRRLAPFDFPAVPSSAQAEEGPRELAQQLRFRVRSKGRHLPESYSVAVMAQDIGYYHSADVNGEGKEQSFCIPDLDYPEGTLFTVHVSGKLLPPEAEEEPFAPSFNYGPTYENLPADTCSFSFLRAHLLPASHVSAAREPAFYTPERVVGPYSTVFERRQVKLRSELEKYDDMDLMTYISVHFAGMVVTSRSYDRTMYTTRGGSVSQHVVASHGEVKYNNTANYHPVMLYIDGTRQEDWREAATLSVREVQNLYVLRGVEAALYKASAVVLLERRRFQPLPETKRQETTTAGFLPLGWQIPKAFSRNRSTLYWNPCVRTDSSGRCLLPIPALHESGYYLRLEGTMRDGQRVSAACILD